MSKATHYNHCVTITVHHASHGAVAASANKDIRRPDEIALPFCFWQGRIKKIMQGDEDVGKVPQQVSVMLGEQTRSDDMTAPPLSFIETNARHKNIFSLSLGCTVHRLTAAPFPPCRQGASALHHRTGRQDSGSHHTAQRHNDDGEPHASAALSPDLLLG